MFMVDHMLIKLGKYLRILGYDAEWDPHLRTHELIHRANAEHRVFVTRNTRLADQYPAPRVLVSITSTDPPDQLRQVITELGLDTQAGLFSKCIRCNLRLDDVPDKHVIRHAVHPNVYARYDRFYTCPGCGTVFWHGTHVENTKRKLGLAQASDGPQGRGYNGRVL
jgi:uncharacterized protein with PIN domain